MSATRKRHRQKAEGAVGVFTLYTCTYCGNASQRGNTGTRKRNGYYIFTDKDGRAWRGDKCPTCCEGSGVGKMSARTEWTERRCRKCGSALPRTRYFDCYTCVEQLEPDNGDLVYHEVPHGYFSEGESDDHLE